VEGFEGSKILIFVEGGRKEGREREREGEHNKDGRHAIN
jgi:hypothetical protein